VIIVGEKINTSLKGVTEAVKNRDVEVIRQRAIDQTKNGAHYIDVNCGGTLIDQETKPFPGWLRLSRKLAHSPCCIDSPNPLALAAAVKLHKGKPMINSITAEKERYNSIIPLVRGYNAAIVALVMDDEHGMPKDAPTRIKSALA